MVWEVLLAAALGGLLGSAVQALINRKNVTDQIEAQNQRHRSDFVMGKKYDALMEAYAKLRECRRVFGHYKNERYSAEIYNDEIQPALEKFREASSMAQIFLDGEKKAALNEVETEANTYAKGYLEPGFEDDRIDNSADWKRFLSAVKRAKETIENEINEPIAQLDEE